VGYTIELASVSVLLVAAAFDLRTRRIPNQLSLGGTFGCLVIAGASDGLQGIASAAGWAALTAGGPAALHIKDPQGMGGGDVKLALLCGASFGWLGPAVLAGSALLGLVWSLIDALCGGLDRLRRGLPFAPFLAAGGIAAMLAG